MGAPGPTPVGHVQRLSLAGVSCYAPGDCAAVGSFYRPSGPQLPIVERSTAGHWALQATVTLRGGGGFDAVSCRSAASCVAVGFSGSFASARTLAESWNGEHWVVQSTS